MGTIHKKKVNVSVLKRLRPYIVPFKKTVFFLLLFNTLCSLIDIGKPLLQRYVIDEFIEKGNYTNLASFGAVYTGIILFQALCVVGFTRAAFRIDLSLGSALREDCFAHLQELSLSFFNETPVGQIVARVTSDVDKISGALAWNVLDILWAITYVVGVLIAMFSLDWRLALYVGSLVPFLAILTFIFQEKLLKIQHKMRKENAKMVASYNEGITGAKTSKCLGIEEKMGDEFAQITTRFKEDAIENERLSGIYLSLVVTFGAIAIAVVLKKGGYFVLHKGMELGTLSAFIAYAIGMFEPVQQIARNLSELIAMQANLERVLDLIDQKPMIDDTKEVKKQYGSVLHPQKIEKKAEGKITFSHVDFHYPGSEQMILEDFQLVVEKGTTIAIVGDTGAGKSTIVNLICRFFEPTKGEILIDDVNYKERSLSWLHQQIGYVLQTPHLFSGTIADNVRYGKLDATLEEINEAARKVGLLNLIEHLPQGWNTPVGEGGSGLSTGEKQLVSFARAILADPAIFILDEATSSIDTKTEEMLQMGVEALLKGRTSFVIAHRLSTIQKADCILVAKKGKIVERGTHEMLLAQKGIYYQLYQEQFK